MIDTDKGLYVPAKGTLYILKSTKWTNTQLVIDRLRKVLLAKGILDITASLLSGDKREVASFVPVIMTVKDAKSKGYIIEELFGTETEKRRVEKAEEPEKRPGLGRFKKN